MRFRNLFDLREYLDRLIDLGLGNCRPLLDRRGCACGREPVPLGDPGEGERVRESTACSPSLRIPAISGNDDSGADSVPAGREPATDAPLANDCAVTTLRLNQLQAEIEAQPEYVENKR